MRIVLFALAVLAAAAGIRTPAQAEDYSWCAVLDMGDAAYNCGFVSRGQCMATVSGVGGYCEQNTFYQRPGPARRLRGER